MPERQGWRALLVGLIFALAGPAAAETPTRVAANKPEIEKRRDLPTEAMPLPRARNSPANSTPRMSGNVRSRMTREGDCPNASNPSAPFPAPSTS